MKRSSEARAPRMVQRTVDRMLFREYEDLAAGLPAFRILLSLLLLVMWAYNAEWVTRLPASFLDPAPGPFLLMQDIPPVEVIRAIEIGRVLALGALLVGWRTPAASVMSSVLTMAVYGIAYSFGKIDHSILLAITPMVLAPSGWGRRWSVDALRGRRPPPRGWPVALLAVAFGCAYATAGLAKAAGGWLAWDTQAAQGYVLRLVRSERDIILGPLLERIDAPVLWELADLATVGLEVGVALLALRLRWFRAGLVGLVSLHVAVFFTMGIDFGKMTYVYAAFLPWDRITARVDAWASALAPAVRRTMLQGGLALGIVPISIAIWSTISNKLLLIAILRATVPSAEPWVMEWHLALASLIAGAATVRWLRHGLRPASLDTTDVLLPDRQRTPAMSDSLAE